MSNRYVYLRSGKGRVNLVCADEELNLSLESRLATLSANIHYTGNCYKQEYKFCTAVGTYIYSWRPSMKIHLILELNFVRTYSAGPASPLIRSG